MKKEPRKILVPTDFSEPAEAALPYAAGLARALGAELHLLHVSVLHEEFGSMWERKRPGLEDLLEVLQQQTGDLLEALAERARAEGAEVSGAERRGIAAAPVILDYVEEEGIDLIVMATHGRRGFRKLFLGSVTQEVVRHSPVPVLTVRGGEGFGEGDDAVSILVAADLSPASEALVESAATLAKLTGASVRLLHAVHLMRPKVVYEELPEIPEVSWERLETEARERLDQLAKGSGLDPAKVSIEVVKAAPAEAILDRCAGAGAPDLVLVAHRQRSGVDRLFLGSIADRVVNRSPIPVLTVPVGTEAMAVAEKEESASELVTA